MAVGNSVNDEIREQHQKLKGKSLKEKWAYFWEYYRIATLVTICVVAAAISLIYTIATQKDSALEVGLVNTYLGSEVDSVELADDFAVYAQVDTDVYEVLIDTDMTVDYSGTDQCTYVNIQKITAMVAAGSLDAILTNTEYLDRNLSAGMFIDLRECFTEEELARYEDRIIYRIIPDEDEEVDYSTLLEEETEAETEEEVVEVTADDEGAIPIGIDVSDSKYMYSDELDAWFCITSTSQNVENAKLFLEYLLEP